jgi:predicted  nucleic acid-binding Zn-ribbon protein
MADTKTLKATLQHDLDRLVEAGGELRVQLQLAKAEVKEEWARLEEVRLKVQNELKLLGDHTKEPVKDIGAAVQKLLDELKHGYERIRGQLK